MCSTPQLQVLALGLCHRALCQPGQPPKHPRMDVLLLASPCPPIPTHCCRSAGRFIQGAPLLGPGSWQQRVVGAGYKQVCGEATAWGDGVVPVPSGARQGQQCVFREERRGGRMGCFRLVPPPPQSCCL